MKTDLHLLLIWLCCLFIPWSSFADGDPGNEIWSDYKIFDETYTDDLPRLKKKPNCTGLGRT